MEDQAEQAAMPETPIEASEDNLETEQQTDVEQVEDASEPTTPIEEKQIPLKAVQEERRKRQEIKQEADYWRKVALGEIENPHKPEPLTEKPKPDQYGDYDEFVEALSDWKAEQVFQRQSDKRQTLTREDIAKREESKVMAKAAQDAEKAAAKYADFYDVAANVTLPKNALDAIYQSDMGTEITYYLGKNPAELDRIADLSPSRQIMELGKLEVKLATKTANPEAKRTKQATQVESAGNGFSPPKTNLSQLRDKAIQSGNWSQYLIEAGFVQ